MSKKLVYILAVFVAISSCDLLKQPITFQKETGFHRNPFHDYDAVIERGFALGEEEIYIETHRAYRKSGFVYWQGKTIDKNGDELPFVEFYVIDSTYYEDIQNTDKFHESYYGHFLGSSDEHGNFNIRSRTKSCQGFFVDQTGYLGTIYYLRRK